MDEAFRSLSATLLDFTGHSPAFGDEVSGQKLTMTGIEIASPVELQVTRSEDGRLVIGTTPPLYPLMTTLAPVFHGMRVRASTQEEREAGYGR